MIFFFLWLPISFCLVLKFFPPFFFHSFSSPNLLIIEHFLNVLPFSFVPSGNILRGYWWTHCFRRVPKVTQKVCVSDPPSPCCTSGVGGLALPLLYDAPLLHSTLQHIPHSCVFHILSIILPGLLSLMLSLTCLFFNLFSGKRKNVSIEQPPNREINNLSKKWWQC